MKGAHQGSRRAIAFVLALGTSLALAAPDARAAKPYEDTRRRFRIELPEGWGLSPQFGDVNGMVFQKKIVARRKTTLAILVVHIDDFAASDVKDYADKMEAELRSQPGFQRASERAGLIGGKPALVREFKALVSKKPRIEKTIQAHFIDAGGHMYMLHFESPTSDFAKVSGDVEKMLASFTPLARGDASAQGSIDRSADGDPAPNLAGRWVNDDGLLLVLGGEGSFALAETQGRYEVKDGQLTLIIPGQGRESFTFAHDAAAGTLTLSSANLGTPMVYRRMKGGQPPPKTEPKKPAAPQLTPTASELVGRWSTPTPSGALLMELRSDRTFSMGKMSGQWNATSDRLTLTRDGSELVSYRWRWSGDQLVLAGGDLDEDVTFTRQGP